MLLKLEEILVQGWGSFREHVAFELDFEGCVELRDLEEFWK